MISRTTIGRSFAGLVRYQFEGRRDQPVDKQAEVLSAVGVRADSAANMSMDFHRGRQLNPNLGPAVWHTSLSFNPDDAARLDSPKMLAIAEGYVQKMGLDKTQYAIIRHHDQPDNQHLHIIANRVGNDGKTIKDGQNFYRSKQALVELIQEHGLTPPKGLRPEKQHPARLHGVDLTKHEIKEALGTVLATAISSKAVREELQKHEVTVQLFQNKEGKPTGISFEKNGQTFKGSEVHRSYSMANIDKQLVANQATQQAAQAREAAELQAEKARQEAVQRAAAQVAEREAAEQRAAALRPKVPELPAIERKWQGDYQRYLAGIAQQNAPIQARNKIIDSYSNHLKANPNEDGIKQVMQKMGTDPHMATLKAELERQVAARAYHADQWARSYGRQAELEEQAKGNVFRYKNAEAKEAAEKLEFLRDKNRPLPSLLAPNVLAFARAAKAADYPAPTIGFEARAYYQPEQVGVDLAAYAAKREAEKHVVVRVSEPASEIQTTGRAEAMRNMLTSKGAIVSMSQTIDNQGVRLSEVTVQYSLQQPRSEVEDINRTLDWAAERKEYEVKESDADRAQRQAFVQRTGQQVKTHTQDKGQSLG